MLLPESVREASPHLNFDTVENKVICMHAWDKNNKKNIKTAIQSIQRFGE